MYKDTITVSFIAVFILPNIVRDLNQIMTVYANFY